MDFEAALQLVRQRRRPHEQTAGREACYGIDRRTHPHWPGWSVIEALGDEAPQGSPAFETLLADDVMLWAQVRRFYAQVWADLELDTLGAPWRRLIFDTQLELGAPLAWRLFALTTAEILSTQDAAGAMGGMSAPPSTMARTIAALPTASRLLLLKAYLLKRIFFYATACTPASFPWLSESCMLDHQLSHELQEHALSEIAQGNT